MAPTATTCCLIGVVGDIFVVVLIWVSSVLIRQLAKPFHRGFYKDDESLMYPYKEGTIPASALYGVGFGLPSLAIILVEGGWVWLRQRDDDSFIKRKHFLLREILWNVYKVGVVFYFGTGVTHFSTNVPKYAIGRHRPHYFAVCQPDWSKVVNNTGFIEQDICTGQDQAKITEAMVSFPSGHASMAMYCALFISLYLQRRFTWQGVPLLRPFLQTVFLSMGFYTCLSRISDYKHHWSDVLFGGFLGALVAVIVFYAVGKRSMPGIHVSASSASDRGMLVQANNSNNEPPPQSTAL